MSRLDPLEVAMWRARYERARMAYQTGVTSYVEAVDALRNLRYRGEALKIEVEIWHKEKLAIQKAKLAVARRKLRDYIYEPGTPTTPSSL